MILTNASGDWIPAVGGIPCPHDPDLTVEAVLLSSVPERASKLRRPGGPAISSDGGLYVVLRTMSDPGAIAGDQPLPVVRSAVWTPSAGWMDVVNDWMDLRSLPEGQDLGLSLYALVLEGAPPPRVAEWLAGILVDPAGIVLALQVMES